MLLENALKLLRRFGTVVQVRMNRYEALVNNHVISFRAFHSDDHKCCVDNFRVRHINCQDRPEIDYFPGAWTKTLSEAIGHATFAAIALSHQERIVAVWQDCGGRNGRRRLLRVTLDGRRVVSDRPELVQMIDGAIAADEAGPLIDWLEEFATSVHISRRKPAYRRRRMCRGRK